MIDRKDRRALSEAIKAACDAQGAHYSSDDECLWISDGVRLHEFAQAFFDKLRETHHVAQKSTHRVFPIGSVPMPENAQEARAMNLLSEGWLKGDAERSKEGS